MKKLLSIISNICLLTKLLAKKTVLLSVALVFAYAVMAQNEKSIGTDFSQQKHLHDRNALSEKMLAPVQVQTRPDLSVRSDAIDLGDGMALLGSDVDANSTLLTVKVNNSQWENLIQGNS